MIIFRIDDSLFIELYEKYRITHTIRNKNYGYAFHKHAYGYVCE